MLLLQFFVVRRGSWETLKLINTSSCLHNSQSGLTAAVKASNLSLTQAEDIMVDFVKKHVSPKVCPLAGNSVHEDRRFLMKYMPRFLDHLHYRIIDVSTLKELCRYVIIVCLIHI